MRRAFALTFALTALVAPAAFAADQHGGHAGHADMAAKPASLTEGVVKKVDKAAGKLTLAHGALSNGMPPMTMVYKVKDAALLANVQPGQKVRFAVADDGMTVVRLEAAK